MAAFVWRAGGGGGGYSRRMELAASSGFDGELQGLGLGFRA